MTTLVLSGGPIFTGDALLKEHCAVFTDGLCTNIVPDSNKPGSESEYDLKGNILSPGFADLQVNGGGGVLFNDDPSVTTLKKIATAQYKLGTTRLLTTLITSTADKTHAAIDAVISAIASGVTGIEGLHLEGPHLCLEKKGAHDGNLIRPMLQTDLQVLLDAAQKLPVLKVTVAPENVSSEQIEKLANAGVIVALGHTNASYDTCMAYHSAGATCVTHLFNAMSQFGSRDPGLVGVALDTISINAGLIADGIHVHPTTIRTALNSMGGMKRIYLVSDAMAVAGTTINSFELDGRTIHRHEGRLTLSDGTLAGADLQLTGALNFLVNNVGVELVDALCSAITVPRRILSKGAATFTPLGLSVRDFIQIDSKLNGVTPVSKIIEPH